MNLIERIHPVFFIIVATSLEAYGDKIIRTAMYHHSGAARFGLMAVGALLLFGYGFLLNLAPVEFGRIVGLYIATLFIVWQIVTYLTTQSIPTLPMMAGGALIVAGGLIVTFWGK